MSSADPAQPSPPSATGMPTQDKPVDIVFLQDATGSQAPYIKAAKKTIIAICDKIAHNTQIPKDKIRFGLIAFRDHPPQENTWVLKQFPFTADMKEMEKHLSTLVATGGGDGPEAQTAALAAALNLEWAEGSVRMVILITDSPPHGLGEEHDGFTESPDQNDPLDIGNQMSDNSIVVHVIACKPAMDRYKFAWNFYKGLTQKTGGSVHPLKKPEHLGSFIAATAIETIETDRLKSQYETHIASEVHEHGKSFDDVVDSLHQNLVGKESRSRVCKHVRLTRRRRRKKKRFSTFGRRPRI